MGKSLDFCKERIRSGQAPLYIDRDFSFAEEYEDTLDYFQYSTGVEDFSWFAYQKMKFGDAEYVYSVYYDDNADYNYFVSQSAIHDGTLVFELETIRNVIGRVANGMTFNIAKGVPCNGCHVKYTIGNLVVINEFNEHGFGDLDNGGIKLMSRTTVMLPIKYEITGEGQ